jgi:methyltransferase (TIGR00027 family)
MQRAAHQTLDRPPVFEDPLAVRIIGPRARAAMDAGRVVRSWYAKVLRAVLVVRSRVAEDTLSDAVAAGVRQYVVLGAGLDTFGLRNTNPDLHVFEVDHPNTQTWKRQRIVEEGLTAPATLRFVAVDFNRQDLEVELRRAGLRAEQPTFFSWLGVVPYLDPPAIRATLTSAARLSRATGGIVFDFFAPPGRWQLLIRLFMWLRGRRVAQLGEPFRAPLRPDDARQWLAESGFARIEILDPKTLTARYLHGRTDGLRMSPLTYVAVARGAGALCSTT